MTEWINHAAAAAAYYFRKLRKFFFCFEIRRVRVPGEEEVTVNDKAAAFQGNVLDCMLPFGNVVGIGRNIKGNAVFI